MISKLYHCLPVRRNLFLKTLFHFRFDFSVLANSNVSSENILVHFFRTRFNMSPADTAKILKMAPRLFRLKTLDNAEQLAYVLNKHGCSDIQIGNMITCYPKLMLMSAERVVEPKFQLLKDSGLAVEFITKNPRIMDSKIENLQSNLELLKAVFTTRDTLIKAIKRNSYILRTNLQNHFEPSVAFWEDFGFRGIELTEFFSYNPMLLTRSSLTPEQLDIIRKIGIPSEGKNYRYLVSRVAICRAEVSEAKIENLQLCGFSPQEVRELVRVFPVVLSYSQLNVKEKMDFILNHMGLSVNFVKKHPRIFSMSLDKVVKPRFQVLRNMAAIHGAEEVGPTRLFSLLIMTQANFIAKTIQGHPDSAALCTLYKNAVANVSGKLKDQELLVS